MRVLGGSSTKSEPYEYSNRKLESKIQITKLMFSGTAGAPCLPNIPLPTAVLGTMKV